MGTTGMAADAGMGMARAQSTRVAESIAPGWTARVIRSLVSLAALLSAGAFLFIAMSRISYPFEIGLMEGNFLVQVDRVLHGQPLYVAPTLAYAPMVYGPLYFYVSAFLAKLIGIGFAPMRLVSFLSALGCFFVLYRFVVRETSNRFSGFMALGLFAATFRETGYCLDMSLTDPLYLFLLVLGAYWLRWHRGYPSLVLAGMWVALSFLTKQTALLVAIPLAGYALLLGWRRFVVFVGTAGGIGAAGIAFLHYQSGGWSSFYLFSVTSVVFTACRQFLLFWPRDVFQVLPIAALLTLLWFLDTCRDDRQRPAVFFYACFGTGLVTAAWMYSLNWGAAANGRLPVYFFLCLASGLGMARALELLREFSAAHKTLGQNVLFAALILQFLALTYNPLQVIPRHRDIEAGRQVVAQIAKIPGVVYFPYHPYLAASAGKPALAHMMNLRFLLQARDQRAVEPLRAELREAFRTKRFSAVMVDGDWTHELIDEEYRADLLDNYTKSEAISYSDNAVFRTRSGMMIRPEFVYLPKAEADQ
jgi:hypothetical protein